MKRSQSRRELTWRNPPLRQAAGTGRRTAPPADERAKEILYNLGLIAETEGNASDARSCFARIFEIDIGYRDVAAKMERYR